MRASVRSRTALDSADGIWERWEVRRIAVIVLALALGSPAAAQAAETWLPARTADPAVANETIAGDVETAFDTDGTLLAVTVRNNTSQFTQRAYAYVRPPGGEVTRTLLATDAENFYDIAVDPRGGLAVAWWPDDGTTNVKIRRRPPGGEFGPTETLDLGVSAPFFQWEIAPDGEELWASHRAYVNGPTPDRRLVIATRSGPGQPLGAPQSVTPNDLDTEDGNFGGEIDLEIGPSGAAAVAAEFRPTGAVNGSLVVARRAPGAASFGAPDEVAPVSQVERPDVEVDAAGRATVVFSSTVGGETRVRTAEAPADTGDFGAITPLSAPGDQNHNFTDLAMAPDGSAVVGFGGGGTPDQWAAARGPSPADPAGAPLPFNVPMRIDGGFPNTEPPQVAMAEDGVAYAVIWSGNAAEKDIDAWRTANPVHAFTRTRVAEDGGSGDAHEYAIGSEGNAVVVYKGNVGIDNQKTLMLVPYDDEPPTVSLAGPGSLFTGAAGAFTATPFDYWGPVTTEIAHSDGGTGSPHAFAAPGTYDSTATATDLAGFSSLASTQTTVTTPAPPPAGSGQPAGTGPPAATAATARQVIRLPSNRRCVSRRRFRIRLRRPGGLALRSAVVHVNGKRVKVVRGRRLRAVVDLRGLPRGRFRVRITVTTRAGRTLAASRRYRTCARKRTRRSAPRV